MSVLKELVVMTVGNLSYESRSAHIAQLLPGSRTVVLLWVGYICADCQSSCWDGLIYVTKGLSSSILATSVAVVICSSFHQSFGGSPCWVLPISSWYLSLEMVLTTQSSAFHALPVRILTPASLNSSSLDWLSCSTTWVFSSLYPKEMHFNGSSITFSLNKVALERHLQRRHLCNIVILILCCRHQYWKSVFGNLFPIF